MPPSFDRRPITVYVCLNRSSPSFFHEAFPLINVSHLVPLSSPLLSRLQNLMHFTAAKGRGNFPGLSRLFPRTLFLPLRASPSLFSQKFLSPQELLLAAATLHFSRIQFRSILPPPRDRRRRGSPRVGREPSFVHKRVFQCANHYPPPTPLLLPPITSPPHR